MRSTISKNHITKKGQQTSLCHFVVHNQTFLRVERYFSPCLSQLIITGTLTQLHTIQQPQTRHNPTVLQGQSHLPMLYSFHHHWHLTTNNSLCLQSTGPGDLVLLPTSYPSDHHWCLPTVCYHQAVITQYNQAVLMIQCYLLCLSS